MQFTSTFRIFFKCNLFSTLSYFYQRQVSALTMLTNVIKYISIALVLFLFMFDCLLFRSYIPYFCPRVCDGSHLHKIIIDLDQILVIEDRLIDKIHPITLKSVINYTQLQLLFFQLSHPWKSHYLIRCSKKKNYHEREKKPRRLWSEFMKFGIGIVFKKSRCLLPWWLLGTDEGFYLLLHKYKAGV